MEKKNFNEVLKAREAKEAARRNGAENEPMHLDDTQRVKVLSPGRLVFKRFMRNKLAIVGSCILIFMFVFSFLGPIFYPYGQTEIFYKYDYLNVDYASATQRTEYISYSCDPDVTVDKTVLNQLNSTILKLESAGQSVTLLTGSDGVVYLIEKLGDLVYAVGPADASVVASAGMSVDIGTFNGLVGAMTYTGSDLGDDFVSAVASAVKAGAETFTFDGAEYSLTKGSVKMSYDVTLGGGDGLMFTGEELGDDFAAAAEEAAGLFTFSGSDYAVVRSDEGMTVYRVGSVQTGVVTSPFVFDAYVTGTAISDELKAASLLAMYGSGSFELGGEKYSIREENDTWTLTDETAGAPVALLGDFAVRRYSGEDSLPIEFKAAAQAAIEAMLDADQTKTTFTYALPEVDSAGDPILDENGQPIYLDTEITVTTKTGQYVLNCEQLTHLIDIYGSSSREHVFGTDANGMDVLARMMYGGRVSLMVGFVVVILECLLGVVLGGIAGYFGGWIDTLIMRLVDIFYCIPSMPILIILGAFFDSLRLSSYMRLVWMMAVLGFLGWAGVARLVRGQILSLREQEFMTAAEATGISTSRRIFRHLIPNVMPQLIVNATMGLGSVIITESTLSFLGLGVKHPLATWGTMINSITSSNENLIRYAYIWIPIGCLICLTVIAFNFVGDGLRDAFDPKMKQ